MKSAESSKKIAPVSLILAACLIALSASVFGIVKLVSQKGTDDIRDNMLQILEEDKGEYDEHTIVLRSTNRETAEMLAEKLGASLRITSNGEFATLTLPEDIQLSDIFADEENSEYLKRFSLDYHAKVADYSDDADTDENYSEPLYSISDSLFYEQKYLNYMNLSDVWTKTRGAGRVIAVIDTGIDYDHPEFIGRISSLSYNASENKVVKDNIVEGAYDWSLIDDEVGHGTAVAGVIHAAMDGQGIVGVAPEATLIVIKAECDQSGAFARTSDLVFGLYYAIECGADVVNMSFGGYFPENPFEDATALAVANNVICIAAAGNDATATLCWPAADPNVISVGALAENSWELAGYSNFGDNADIVAPGTVYSCETGGKYKKISGTSFAAPLTAAAAVLYCAENTNKGTEDFREILYASAYDLGDLGEDYYFGYGALDVSALVFADKGTVTFNYMTDELENTTQSFICNHTLQELPSPERLYAVFDGWYYDPQYTDPLKQYEDVFTADVTLYAKWANEDDGIPYGYKVLSDGTVEILSYLGNRRYISIPDYIEGKQVSSIGENAFYNQTELRIVNLPRYLVKINDSAFRNCSNLTSVEIPDSVTEIGYMAFADCPRLSAVQFGSDSKLEKIGDWAFSGCGNMRSFTLPAKVNSVNATAFYMTASLKSIDVHSNNKFYTAIDGMLFNYSKSQLVFCPMAKTGSIKLSDSVKQINKFAFVNSKLNNVDLNSVERIEEISFYQSAIQTLAIPDTVTFIADGSEYQPYFSDRYYGVFDSCAQLSKVTLGSGLQNVASLAFYNDSQLKRVIVPNDSNISTIEDYAFALTGLSEFAFPAKLEQIGIYAFYGAKLTSAELPQNLELIDAYAFELNKDLTAVSFPQKLSVIGDYAFLGTGITEITLPASLNTLGYGAFASCSNLSSVFVDNENKCFCEIDGVVYTKDGTRIVIYPSGSTRTSFVIPTGVTSIDISAFEGNTALKSVSIPDTVTVIDAYAFYNCRNIQIVELGSGLKSICEYAFANCVSLNSPVFNYGISYIGKNAFYNTSSFTTVTLPNSMTVLGKECFSGCGATSYILPETLVEIGEKAFRDNQNLSSLYIPKNVVSIGKKAFEGDYSLKTIEFASGSVISSIQEKAFSDCGITSFTVPASVLNIESEAFSGCHYLSSFSFAANSQLKTVNPYTFNGCSSLTAISFQSGSSLERIDAHGFEGMPKLKTVNFGNAPLTEIGDYAFRFCESLSTVSLPKGVKYIGRCAFYACYNFTLITIPRTVEKIGGFAFLGDEKLNVYFEAEQLPTCLQEDWDHGIKGYYLGVSNAAQSGDWQYIVTNDGCIGIVDYTGTATEIDLTKVNLGGNITTIGSDVFAHSDLKAIVLPESLKTISDNAFYKSRLERITIPASVVFIGQYAFADTPLEAVVFSGKPSVSVIEKSAFENTANLASIELPASISSLGRAVFRNSGLKSVSFASGFSLEELPESAFSYSELESVIIPDSVRVIGSGVFRGTENLKTVVFPTVHELSIKDNAFYLSGLSTLNIPANVTYIGEYAFAALGKLKTFEVNESNLHFKSVDGLLYNKKGTKLISVPAARTGSLTVPSCVEIIGYGAFERSSLTSVLFEDGNNLLTLGYRAFFGMELLKEISVPETVISIDYYAFAYCKSLEKVTFSDGSRLTGIYEGAFYGCSELNEIELPASIVEISDFAFFDCKKITSIPVNSYDNLRGIYSYAMAYTGISELTIPSEIIDIGDYAFLGTPLVSVTFETENDSEYTLHIGLGAFEDCNYLKEITVPFVGPTFEDTEFTWFGYIFGAGSYKSGSDYVPGSLKEVTVSGNITFLGNGAFYKLSTISKITFPDSITKKQSNSLLGVKAAYQLNGYIEREVEDDTYYVENGVLTVLDGVKKVKDINCTDLEINKIVLPESLEEIEGYCFLRASCYDITLPKSLKSISPGAFQGSKIKVIYNNSNLVPGFTSNFLNSYLVVNSDGSVIVNPNEICEIVSNTIVNFSIVSAEIIEEENYKILDLVRSDIGSKKYILNPTVVNKEYTAISGYELLNYSGIDTLVVEEGRETIAEGEFASGSFSRIVLPNTLKTIGDKAFAQSNLKEIIIPDSVTDIGERAFYYCEQLTYVKLPEGLDSLSMGLFNGCSNLQYLNIPDSVQLIDEYAFSNSGITEISIPDSVREIRTQAFGNCNNLCKIKIGEKIDILSLDAFTNCNSLKSFVIANGNKNYSAKDGVIYNKERTKILGYTNAIAENLVIPDSVTELQFGLFKNCELITSVFIPDSVKKLGGYLFYGCENLESVRLPDSISSIPTYTFYGCRKLNDITIPASVSKIEICAFDNSKINILRVNSSPDFSLLTSFNKCEIEYLYVDTFEHWSQSKGSWIHINATQPIKNIIIEGKTKTANFDIPDGVTSIAAKAFANDKEIETVNVPSSVREIDATAFQGCENLKEIHVDKDNPYFVVCDNILYSIDKTKLIFAPDGILGDIVVPYGVTEIADSAFYGKKQITSVSLPDTVKKIGDSAFESCTSLEFFVIPDTVSSIGKCAFKNCYSMSNVSIGSGLKAIPESMFEGCKALGSVTLPEGICHIGARAFSGCSLTELSFPSTLMSFDSHFLYGAGVDTITIPEGIQIIPQNAFSGSGVRKLILPDSVVEISGSAFSECNELSELTLGKGLTTINDDVYGAFADCGAHYITNNSSLQLSCGSTDNGSIAYMARVIREKNGNITYYTGSQITEEGFVFAKINSKYELISYCGNSKSVILPKDYKGQSYKIASLPTVTEVEFESGTVNLNSNMLDALLDVESLIIPATVQNIDKWAIYNMKSLSKITIDPSNSCFEMCGSALWSNTSNEVVYIICSDITELIIPDGTIEIPQDFINASRVTSITIPASVKNIKWYSFSAYSSLKEIKLSGNNSVYGVKDGILYTADYSSVIYIPVKYTDALVIAEGMESFSYDGILPDVSSIVIPKSLKSLPSDFFSRFKNLKSVSIDPNNVNYTYSDGVIYQNTINGANLKIKTVIGFVYDGTDTINVLPGTEYAYFRSGDNGADKIKEIIFPSGVKYIDLCWLSALEKFNLPDGVQGLKINSIPQLRHLNLSEGITNLVLWNLDGLEEIDIPESVKSLTISNCDAIETLVIPSKVTNISINNCTGLRSVVISDGVTQIIRQAFYGCSVLDTITLPDSLKTIYSDCFNGTQYYQDNYEETSDGAKYIGTVLLKAPAGLTNFIPREGTRFIAQDAYSGNTKIKTAMVSMGCDVSGFSNIETLIINSVSDSVYEFFGKKIPVTLKNIVINPISKIGSMNLNFLKNVSGLNIYIVQEENDLRWDENFPGWSGNNRVYYGNEWSSVSFRGIDGSLLKYELYTNAQVIRQPHIEEYWDNQYTYRIVGWDIDGDGINDVFPATTDVNIDAYPVINRISNQYTVSFYDIDGKVCYQTKVGHGDSFSLIEAPVHPGYTFVRWEGYAENLIADSNADITGVWQHVNGGHKYDKTEVVAPTCYERGYTKHVCSDCGEWYADSYTDRLTHNYVKQTVTQYCGREGCDLYTCDKCGDSYKENVTTALEHSWGQVLVDKPASCLVKGEGHRVCERCKESQKEEIDFDEHNYVLINSIPATCNTSGKASYQCSKCNYSVVETLSQISHVYSRMVVSNDELEVLLEFNQNLKYSKNGRNAIVYKCNECGSLEKKSGTSGMGIASVMSAPCAHETSHVDKFVLLSGSHTYVDITKCDSCRKNLNTQYYLADHKFGEPKYHWNGTQCTATRICTLDNTHTETETANGVYHKDTDAGCLTEEKGHLVASFINKAFSAQETSKDSEIIPSSALNHSFTNYVSDGNAQCVTDGTKTAKCDRCDAKDTKPDIGSAINHDYQWVVDKAATENAVGLKHEKCSRCEATRNLNTIIPKLGATSRTSLSNSAVQTAWNLKFKTIVYASQLEGSGASISLTFDKNVVSYISHTANPAVNVELDLENSKIVLSTADSIVSNTAFVELEFMTSDELVPGKYEYLHLSDGDAANEANFTGFTIYQIGDVNMDGNVNSRDVTLIKQSVVKMITLTEVQKAYADAYTDQSVNSRDATLITQYVVHMPVKLGDRVEVSFTDSVSEPDKTETVSRSVHSGNTLRTVPEAPQGYHWSESATVYIIPNYTNITVQKKYYLFKKES